MNKFIVLLLILETVRAQTGLDKLVLKNGIEYLGEYKKTEGNTVHFKQRDKFLIYQHTLISTLKLKDGRVLINEGYLTKQTNLNSEKYEQLTLEEKAVYIEIKASYDAKKEAIKWGLYPILSATTFSALITSMDDKLWDIPRTIGIGAVSLGIPFYFLKQNSDNIKGVIPEEIELYEEIYHREFRKWVFINVTVSSAATVGFGLFLFLNSNLGLSGSFGGGCGPPCGDPVG